MSDRPTAGARFVLEREQADAARATYRVAIHTPDATFAGRAVLAATGDAEVDAGGAPGELANLLISFAKLTARGAEARDRDGLDRWPARIARWRGPGRGLE